jgi:glycosyltransferase involved in cell wall biosynthesis
VALVAGRLFSVKGVEPLLACWQRLPEDVRSQWTLLFVGDGPLAQAVADAATSRPAGEIVHIPAVQPRELVEFYLTSDLLIFPSLGDVWGLAVNEAMACGLPVVCSTRAGCAEDLIVEGENGWLTDPLDTSAFTTTLKQALTCERRGALGECARTTLGPYTPEATAEGVRRAVGLVRERMGSGSARTAVLG